MDPEVVTHRRQPVLPEWKELTLSVRPHAGGLYICCRAVRHSVHSDHARLIWDGEVRFPHPEPYDIRQALLDVSNALRISVDKSYL